MRRLRIGILGTRGIPNHYGGFEQFAQYLSLGLVQRGHDVYVYSPDNHPYKNIAWNDVQIIHCKDPEPWLGTFGQFFYDLNCINDSRKRNFDILLHLGYTSDSIWHWRWPRNTINIVNMDGMEWKRSKYNKVTQRFLKWAESLAARKAQLLIADSPHMQDYLLSAYGKRAEFIAYGAEVFTDSDLRVFRKFNLTANGYFLLVARMEPENNVEMAIQGYLASKHPYPLVIVGDTGIPFGRHLISKYSHPSIHFIGPVYEQHELDNLRYYSAKYFHGHSVGGTNPSLLEAMACGCDIAAHDNVFNRAILQQDADYFATADDVAWVINKHVMEGVTKQRKQANIDKIITVYNQDKNINDYEQLMFMAACKDGRLNRQITLSRTLYQTAERSL